MFSVSGRKSVKHVKEMIFFIELLDLDLNLIFRMWVRIHVERKTALPVEREIDSNIFKCFFVLLF
jgi:hypothetical protein